MGRRRVWTLNGYRDRPELPGTSRKVEERRKRKKQKKEAKRRKPDKKMTDAEWESTLNDRPLLAEVTQLIDDPFLIHWRKTLKQLQDDMISGRAMSRQRRAWYNKVLEYRAKIPRDMEEKPLSAKNKEILSWACKIYVEPFRYSSTKTPMQVVMDAWKEHGWVTAKMLKIVVTAHGATIDHLMNPPLKKGDLVEVSRHQYYYGNSKKPELGLIAGLPRYERGSKSISYPISNISNAGQRIWAPYGSIKLKKKHVNQ